MTIDIWSFFCCSWKNEKSFQCITKFMYLASRKIVFFILFQAKNSEQMKGCFLSTLQTIKGCFFFFSTFLLRSKREFAHMCVWFNFGFTFHIQSYNFECVCHGHGNITNFCVLLLLKTENSFSVLQKIHVFAWLK